MVSRRLSPLRGRRIRRRKWRRRERDRSCPVWALLPGGSEAFVTEHERVRLTTSFRDRDPEPRVRPKSPSRATPWSPPRPASRDRSRGDEAHHARSDGRDGRLVASFARPLPAPRFLPRAQRRRAALARPEGAGFLAPRLERPAHWSARPARDNRG